MIFQLDVLQQWSGVVNGRKILLGLSAQSPTDFLNFDRNTVDLLHFKGYARASNSKTLLIIQAVTADHECNNVDQRRPGHTIRQPLTLSLTY